MKHAFRQPGQRPYKGTLWASAMVGATLLLAGAAVAGPRGTVVVRPLGNLKLTIDGDFKDWPLEKFTKASEQDLFPAVQDRETSSASGDHLVFDPRRVGTFNNTPTNAYANVTDFGSSVYFAYDAQYLYMLGVFIDDVLRGDRDPSDEGAQPYFNDGWEILVGLKGDTTGCRPTGSDIQVGFQLHDKFRPDSAAADVLGARQTMIVGSGDWMGPGAGQPGNAWQDALDAIGGPNIAARKFADLRAAGARNPELASNPNVVFSGYAIEVRIPWGKADQPLADFTPDHPMGFELFWRDADKDDDPDAGAIGVNWASWAQSTDGGGCTDDNLKINILNTSNWGRMTFDKTDYLGTGP